LKAILYRHHRPHRPPGEGAGEGGQDEIQDEIQDLPLGETGQEQDAGQSLVGVHIDIDATGSVDSQKQDQSQEQDQAHVSGVLSTSTKIPGDSSLTSPQRQLELKDLKTERDRLKVDNNNDKDSNTNSSPYCLIKSNVVGVKRFRRPSQSIVESGVHVAALSEDKPRESRDSPRHEQVSPL